MLAEREEISLGVQAGLSCRAIAARLGRAPSTVSREIARNGGRVRYRACAAERATLARGRRPKLAKLARHAGLRRVVEAKLRKRWSPQQITAWLSKNFPDDQRMRVSHETIYLSLFVQGRGALRRELHTCLRTGRAVRRPRAAGPFAGQGHIRDMILISARPAEADDRAVPGHWEGDLIMGRRKTAVATLVERSTRYVMLLAVPRPTAEAVRNAMTKRIKTLPAELRRSLAWDRGKEMSQHLQFTIDTGVQVYFCDPNSPWQRGTNENTNGLLRQYLPKGSDLSVHTQRDLNAIAAELNARPRQTLGWMTPSEKLAEAVAATG
jgi:IS30 family transposase